MERKILARLGCFVANLRTFWLCLFTCLNNAVVYRNWQIGGIMLLYYVTKLCRWWRKAGVLKLMTLLFPLDDSTFTHRATWFRWVWQCKKAIMPLNLDDASKCRPGKVPGRLCGSPQTPPHLRKHSEVVAMSWEARCQAPGIKMALSSSTGSTGQLSAKEEDG